MGKQQQPYVQREACAVDGICIGAGDAPPIVTGVVVSWERAGNWFRGCWCRDDIPRLPSDALDLTWATRGLIKDKKESEEAGKTDGCGCRQVLAWRPRYQYQ